MQPGSISSSRRILFPGRNCRSETKPPFSYVPPIKRDEMLGYFFTVLGAPSPADVQEYAKVAGEAAWPRGEQVEQQLRALLTTGYAAFPSDPPTDFSVRYSLAHASCPAALALLTRMLCYSPTNRISLSQALRHEFLNPGHADVSVDSTVGDDGHERAKRTAVKLKQLDIEGLCSVRQTRRRTIGDLLRREAELIKLPETPRERRHTGGGHGHRRTPSNQSNDGMDA